MLKEQIYMHQHKGFIIIGNEDYACLLNKSLYGLKQSPKQWNKRFDTFFLLVISIIGTSIIILFVIRNCLIIILFICCHMFMTS